MSILKHVKITDIFSVKELLIIAISGPIFVLIALKEVALNLMEKK